MTHDLRAGAVNAVGLLYHWYGVGKGRPDEPAAAIAQISVWHADGSRELLATDSSWKVARAPWLASRQRNLQGDPVDVTENIDGEHEPVGWDQPGFDARSWPRRHRARPATGRALDEPHQRPPTDRVAARVGAIAAPPGRRQLRRRPRGDRTPAVPTVRFEHGVAGRRITMHAGYALDPDGSVSTTHDVQATDMSYSYIERAGAQTFRPFDYLGFRYLQIDAPGETLTAERRRSSGPPRADARRGGGDLHVVRSVTRRGLGRGRALRDVHRPGAVHRHADA